MLTVVGELCLGNRGLVVALAICFLGLDDGVAQMWRFGDDIVGLVSSGSLEESTNGYGRCLLTATVTSLLSARQRMSLLALVLVLPLLLRNCTACQASICCLVTTCALVCRSIIAATSTKATNLRRPDSPDGCRSGFKWLSGTVVDRTSVRGNRCVHGFAYEPEHEPMRTWLY